MDAGTKAQVTPEQMVRVLLGAEYLACQTPDGEGFRLVGLRRDGLPVPLAFTRSSQFPSLPILGDEETLKYTGVL